MRDESNSAVLAELEPSALRDLPQLDVVFLVAGEVLQRGAPRLRSHRPDVDLEGTRREDACLGGAAPEDAHDHRQLTDRLHDRGRVLRRHEDVDVADGLLHPPDAPGRLGVDHAGQPAQVVGHPTRQRQSVHQGDAFVVRLRALDTLRDVGGGLWPEAGERVELARRHGGLEVLECGDADLLVEGACPLRPDAGHLHDSDERRDEALLHPFHLRERAGLDDLRDDGGELTADPRNLREPAFLGHAVDGLGPGADAVGGLVVAEEAELVGAGDFEQVAHDVK